MTGTKMVHIPYKGGGRLRDIDRQRRNRDPDGDNPVFDQHFQARLIPLGRDHLKRNSALPDIPTLRGRYPATKPSNGTA